MAGTLRRGRSLTVDEVLDEIDGDSGSEIGYDESSEDNEEIESGNEADNSAFEMDFGSDYLCSANYSDNR